MMAQPRSPTAVVGNAKVESPSKELDKDSIPKSPTSATAKASGASASTSSSTTSGGGPLTKQLILLLLFSGGVGVMGGFFVFYSIYNSQCSRLLSTASSKVERLQSLDDRKALAQQQTMLEKQSVLTSQHQDLIVRLSDAQKEQERSNTIIQHQKKEMQTLQRALKEADGNIRKSGEDAIKTRERMQRQLDLARTMLQEKIDEVEELKESADGVNCEGSTMTTSNDKLLHIQTGIRRRDSIQAVSKYGLLPIVVLFLVKSPSQAAISFEVEFSSLHEMPHTIYTFLNLVDAGLYQETSLIRYDKKFAGGTPSTCVRKQAQSKLVRRMAEIGYSMEPVLFTERSKHHCQKGSFGWNEKGPGFNIHVQNSPDEFTCPGTVISGQADLEAFSMGDRITIVDARIVQSAGSDNDEL